MNPALIWAEPEARRRRAGDVLPVGGCSSTRNCWPWLVCPMVGDLWGCSDSGFEFRPLKAPAEAFCCLRIAFTPCLKEQVSRHLFFALPAFALLLLHWCLQGCCLSCSFSEEDFRSALVCFLAQCAKSVLRDPLDLAR